MSHRTPKAVVLTLLACHAHAVAVAAGQCGPTPYDCALHYVQNQEYKTAINTLHEVLKEEPRNLKALNLLGIALTQTGQSQEANGYFQEALRLDPGFSAALKNLAINESTLKQFDASKAHFEKLLKNAPDDEIAHISLAEIDYGRGQCSAALPHYEICRRRVVSSPDLIIHYSRCALQEGGKQQALTMLALLPEGDAQDQFQAGLMLAGAGVFASAAQHFELARHDYPDPYLAAFNAALAHVKAGESMDAIRVANEVFAQGIRRAELYNLVSQAYVEQGKVKEAYDALRTATEIDPQDERNYLDFGLLCLDYSNYDLGVEITEIGMSFLPNSDRLYLQRGLMKAMKRQLGEAAQDFEQSSKLAPDKTLPYVARAIILIQSGQSQEAINLLRQRAQRSPQDFLIHYVLGEALLWSGPDVGSPIEQEALQAFQTSIQLNPDFSHAHAQLGKILLKRRAIEPAIAQLEKARELDPSDPTPVYQLALAYRRKGDKLKAQELEARVGQLHAQKMEDEVRATLRRIAKVGSP